MVYYIGLVFVIILILISIDDFIWDIYILFKSIRADKDDKVITYKELRDTVPGLLAIIIAAYREEDVLEDVVDHLIDTNHYPDAMYHVFLGVFPNDPATLHIADRLSKKYDNVHKVVHVLDGPSSKADNINNVIKNILSFERDRGIRFKGIVIHDSEDVVHPYELLVENYLLNYHDAIQMQLFPLQKMPRLKNIFKNMVSGTYADEFAENHYTMLVARNTTGSFVPSAGTGFAISREILDSFPDHNIFPVGSLTEDYKFSLMLKLKGYHLHYVLEGVERLTGDGEVRREFISTRSIFPSTYRAAVRQKTRWIYGITMQSFKLPDILKNKTLSLRSKYSLYKDWKAKFGNLLLGVGYGIFFYFLLATFFHLPTMFPRFSLSWYLMILITIMMVERQVVRGRAVKNVYGYKSAFISVLLPPLFPFRMFIGNMINFHATLRAWKMRLFGSNSKIKKKRPRWSKTEHEFLKPRVLKTFRRTLCDIVLHENLISTEKLNYALEKSKKKNVRLGEILVEEEIVSEEDVLISLCKINKEFYLDISSSIVSKDSIEYWGSDFLIENLIVPVMHINNTMVFAISNPDDKERLRDILRKEKKVKGTIKFVYSTKKAILDSIKYAKEDANLLEQLHFIEKAVENGLLTLNEGLTALTYLDFQTNIQDILQAMGFEKTMEMSEELEQIKYGMA